MDENAEGGPGPQPGVEDAETAPDRDAGAPKKSAAEYAEAFGKAVDAAEHVLRFAPLPVGAKRAATRAMPAVKKAAKIAPLVAPAAEPYVRKAAEKAKEVAPEVAQAAKSGAKTVASGAKAAATRVHDEAPKLGHAAAGKAARIAGKLKRKNGEGGDPPPPSW